MKTTFYHAAALLLITSCSTSPAQDWEPIIETDIAHEASHSLAEAAMSLTTWPYVTYDASYQRLAYPMGDVPANRGVCADVVIRALRLCGYDLQQLVHEDMRQHFRQYPQKWGLRGPDPHIDHRRVPNLMTFFERHGTSLPRSANPADYSAGDIVAWQLSGGLTHIGIVVPSSQGQARPWVVHNIGHGLVAEDMLFSWKIIGHYRFP